MALDEKSRAYNCHECDINLQVKRNCNNQYDPAKIVLNNEFYEQCPKSLLLNQSEIKFLVNVYFECKELKRYPEPGTSLDQTGFTIELFSFIDEIVNNFNKRQSDKLNTPTQQSGRK